MAKATVITLTDQERATLERWARGGRTEQRLALRSRIVLAAADGAKTKDIAARLRIWAWLVSKWRGRMARHGLAGLGDAPRSGQPRRYTAQTERRVLALLDEPPPSGHATWTASLVAERLGVTADYVWRVLRAHGIHLQRRRSWCVSTDPEFAQKAADIVGLYLDPPQNAVVLSVDEKPQIQALERAQGWLRLPNGRALSGYSHAYTRHGTTTLFAALEVATGQVKAGHFARRRRREFLAFMNELVAAWPERELHVIVDNLNTHKPKRDRWLASHPNVHLHYTPTYASWLNQIETWFSILSRRALRGASFTSPRQLREAIDCFIKAHNAKAAPFVWTKRVVHPKGLKTHYSDLCK